MFYDTKPNIFPRTTHTFLSWIKLHQWMRFPIPKAIRPANPSAEQDLLRLAQASPHLLPDLGFVRDRSRHFPGYEVWVSDRAPYEIHLPTTTSTDCDPHSPCAPAQGFRS